MKGNLNIKGKSEKLDSRITLDYGSGGRKMHRLIHEMFLSYFKNPILAKFEDSAEIDLPQSTQRNQKKNQRYKNNINCCFTVDSYVVQPLFFPGGDIGKLSICGTVNDLAVKGAKPLYIAVSFVIQEGMSIVTLDKICKSMSKTAKSAEVQIVTGDTKVIERKSDKDEIIITTCGIGKILPGFSNPTLGAKNIKIGDIVLINGNIGDHEASIILARGDFKLKAEVKSDCTTLYSLIERLENEGCNIKMMRDPTRGGLATTLNEIADATKLGIVIDENKVPIQKQVKGIAALLGFDPLYMANEGKVVIIADAKDKTKILRIMKRHSLGKNMSIIGEVIERKYGLGVWLKTSIGSSRPLLQLEGFQIPRIC
jgi:hydrogenase expression/formation protein HypE